LRPHTLYRPKPLVSLAGKTILDFALQKFESLPANQPVEYGFILGSLGEQVRDYMAAVYPQFKVRYFAQKEMRGQSHAVYMARELLDGPVLVSFGDTINDPDLSCLAEGEYDGRVWVKQMADTAQMGVIQTGADGLITHLYEKPPRYVSSLVLVGVYYFRQGRDLAEAIEAQFQQGRTLKNEYYLADAINIMIERGAKIHAETVETWLDAGTTDTFLQTNAYLLEHGSDNSSQAAAASPSAAIHPPVSIHASAEIRHSIIGPNVVIEAGCKLDHVVVRDAIIQQGTVLRDMIIEQSFIGRDQNLQGKWASINQAPR
jgi:glucose-1-phosphate thymidylyltransferase